MKTISFEIEQIDVAKMNENWAKIRSFAQKIRAWGEFRQ